MPNSKDLKFRYTFLILLNYMNTNAALTSKTVEKCRDILSSQDQFSSIWGWVYPGDDNMVRGDEMLWLSVEYPFFSLASCSVLTFL